jgi:hypothetical protein
MDTPNYTSIRDAPGHSHQSDAGGPVHLESFSFEQISTNSSPPKELHPSGTDIVLLDPWRWYIVSVYSLFAMVQGLTWAMPGALQVPTYP